MASEPFVPMALEDIHQLLAEVATFHRYAAGHYAALDRLMRRLDWYRKRAQAWKKLAKRLPTDAGTGADTSGEAAALPAYDEASAKLAGQGVDVQQLHARAAAMDGEPETDQIVGSGRGVVSAAEAARVDCPGCVAAYSKLNGGRSLTNAAGTGFEKAKVRP